MPVPYFKQTWTVVPLVHIQRLQHLHPTYLRDSLTIIPHLDLFFMTSQFKENLVNRPKLVDVKYALMASCRS